MEGCRGRDRRPFRNTLWSSPSRAKLVSGWSCLVRAARPAGDPERPAVDGECIVAARLKSRKTREETPEHLEEVRSPRQQRPGPMRRAGTADRWERPVAAHGEPFERSDRTLAYLRPDPGENDPSRLARRTARGLRRRGRKLIGRTKAAKDHRTPRASLSRAYRTRLVGARSTRSCESRAAGLEHRAQDWRR